MEKIEKSVIPVLSTSSVAIVLFFVLCSSVKATTIEVVNDSIHLGIDVRINSFGEVASASDVYDGHLFGNHVGVTSSSTVEYSSGEYSGDFTTYSASIEADHVTPNYFTIGDFVAGYDWSGIPGFGTATFDAALTYEFNVTGGNGRLDIGGYSSSFSYCSLSLFDETVGAMVTDGLYTGGRGLFDLLDSHLYKLDYSISLQTHGDPDPGPYRAFHFLNVGTVTYVPEPSAMLLFSAGLSGVVGIVWRKKKEYNNQRGEA